MGFQQQHGMGEELLFVMHDRQGEGSRRKPRFDEPSPFLKCDILAIAVAIIRQGPQFLLTVASDRRTTSWLTA